MRVFELLFDKIFYIIAPYDKYGVYKWLSESSDIFELERRQRELDRSN